jgi:hypothetical protein
MNHSILIFPVHPTSLAKFLKIALFLREKNVECKFLIATKSVYDRQSNIHTANFESIKLPLTHNASLSHRLKSLLWLMANIWRNHKDLDFIGHQDSSKLGFLRRYKHKLYFLRLQREYKSDLKNKIIVIERLFENNSFDKIIVSGDRSLGYEAILLAHAQKLNIPSIIPPISTSNNPSGLAREKIQKSSNFEVTNNQYFRRKWPKQCFSLQSSSISFYEFWRVKVLYELGILPPCPWHLGGGRSNKYLIGSGLDAIRYIENGLNAKHVTVTGDSEFDELHNAFQNKKTTRSLVISQYELNPALPIIIIGMPQLFEHNLLSYDDHIALITTICDGAQQEEANVLASLHPKMDKENYLFLETKYKFRILKESLSNCLPTADIYISCQGSSTWIWSVLCEIPMIVCDWYGGNVRLGKSEYGLSVLDNANSYPKELHRLLTDSKYFQYKKKQCSNTKPLIMQFDGNSSERIFNNIFS